MQLRLVSPPTCIFYKLGKNKLGVWKIPSGHQTENRTWYQTNTMSCKAPTLLAFHASYGYFTILEVASNALWLVQKWQMSSGFIHKDINLVCTVSGALYQARDFRVKNNSFALFNNYDRLVSPTTFTCVLNDWLSCNEFICDNGFEAITLLVRITS